LVISCNHSEKGLPFKLKNREFIKKNRKSSTN